ncbi:hypothetical protein BV582_05160 [Bacillus paralicheniformis]|uniref:GH25 family lysozyme n=1 Tax=Bacillus paralicheniformis TaxID=1648923 RepID=UPI000C75ACBA|nr:GH25 family lysozyme [Bacillus paralicheniformis]PLC16943.1 hypothetical protein BV582_05160 [Bacillus paralicheniformis]
MGIKGIDVSHWQGNINWKKVAGDGIKFAFIKATEGTTLKDNKFVTNISGANAVGIKTGAYHFARFGSKSEALAEARFFLSVANKVRLTYPLVLDLEVNQRNVSKPVLTDAAVAFLREVEKAGYFAMIYSGKSFLENCLDESKLKPFALWVARYNNTLGRHADIWQYSSNGKVSGISGNVDMNICYRDGLRATAPTKKTSSTAKKKESTKKTVTKNYPLPTGIYKVKSPLMRGTAVRQIQEALAALYFYPDKGAKNNGIDGYYGPKTANAVKRFQMMHGLSADGIYGPKTKAKIEALLK